MQFRPRRKRVDVRVAQSGSGADPEGGPLTYSWSWTVGTTLAPSNATYLFDWQRGIRKSRARGSRLNLMRVATTIIICISNTASELK